MPAILPRLIDAAFARLEAEALAPANASCSELADVRALLELQGPRAPSCCGSWSSRRRARWHDSVFCVALLALVAAWMHAALGQPQTPRGAGRGGRGGRRPPRRWWGGRQGRRRHRARGGKREARETYDEWRWRDTERWQAMVPAAQRPYDAHFGAGPADNVTAWFGTTAVGYAEPPPTGASRQEPTLVVTGVVMREN